MTVIRGTLTDVSGAPAKGLLSVRAASYRGDGEVVLTSDAANFGISDGVLSASVAPGLSQFTLRVGPLLRTWIFDVPDTPTVGLGDLLGAL